MPCEERERLRALHNAASEHFAAAVNDVTVSRGKTSKEEYDRLRAVVDEGRQAAKATLLAWEQHKQQHGC